jgi:hypothetical protein
MGEFKEKDVEKLLVACHRCCCVCHRFCGVKIEIDHIVQQADQGSDAYENAIPVCFECHAEIHSYNPRHPRGRKFRPEELRAHRDQWISICKDHPDIFRRGAAARAEVGPLQALIDELEFNAAVSAVPPAHERYCPFKEQQFLEAIRSGSIATLRDELKQSIIDAYVQIGQANHQMSTLANPHHPSVRASLAEGARASIEKSRQPIHKAQEELLKFLSSEGRRDGTNA